MSTTATYTLSKEERLKSRKMIDLLFEKGKQFSMFPLKVFWIAQPLTTHLQAGVGVSARNFKKATDRNRIKRLMRESYRLQKNPLKEMLHGKEKSFAIFILFTGKALPQFDEINVKMKNVITRLIQLAEAENIDTK